MFSRLLLLILLTISSFVTLFAQSLKLTGKVVNEKNEPLSGVTIKTNKGGGTASDVDGAFSLTLVVGNKYELVFTAVGYTPKSINDVEVIAGQPNELNIAMAVAAKKLEDVVVRTTSSARKESTNALIQYQKNTNTVAQVVSAEAIRRSPDRSTGEVLKRVPGTSIQDGKYLVVRGLSDRYNQAMLNGILLVSTEPDRKTFSFDLFPAAMIDNIIVNKAFVPELPGEWAGGLVQVNTKDIPSKPFFSVEVGTGFNSQTIGHDFYRYKGGKYDWLGFDDGTRRMPDAVPVRSVFESKDYTSEAQKVEYGKMFTNTWGTQAGSVPLNAAFEVNGGFNTNLWGKKAGGVLTLTYRRANRRLPFTNTFQSVADGTPSVLLDYSNERYAQDVLWGALGNFTLQLNPRNKISIKNLFNVNGTDYATRRTGLDLTAAMDSIRSTELGFRSNIYNNTQLIGEHSISDWNTRLKWYGSFTILDQYTPDQRRLQYNKDLTVTHDTYKALLGDVLSQKSGNRFFSNLNDYVYSGGADVAKSFKWLGFNQTAKGGYMLQVRDRLFDARPFSVYLPKNNSSNDALRELDENSIFSPENFDANDDFKFHFDQMSNIKFRYMANNILNAGYIQFDNQFSDLVRLVWGARAEHFDQLVGSVYTSDSRHLHTKQFDILPGANLTFQLNKITNLRFSASQTVIRPELRELVEYEYYDFDLNASVKGLPTLKRTKVSNVDLRYELYPRAGEMFTAGVFFKHFKSPIEAMFNQASGGASSYNFVNAPDAQGFGVEVEGRKKLDFSSALKNFTVFGNLSYIYNRVNFDNKEQDRPMQGQSPYIINLGLQYDLEKQGINTTLLFNQIGRRIVYVGGSDAPAIWERPRPLLDFQVAKKLLNKRAEIKLNISDILNKENFLYYDVDENEQFKKGKDAIFINRKMGTTFGLSLKYNFIQQ
ncbi:carboxypeptidase-like regulatory domain-containing protein [Chitinophagaceae bacterium LB-8]|uniref:Carboxypeptidase-like regulatory domain-containing protein n=1 Tax=Paraflavisolibacter caeni TaxID=2982496 RepID=A0A9X2XSU2_9BACT|nr:TonB-dependent receptor [Paraflavisolibacter caeni]MCU7548291.1 carboxypeptidase-like regulatory domain-containing protein [Paraflavisolibacter caeni]